MQRALQDGINQLARAGNDKALLGMALLNLHAAMEAYFREQLANEISLYEASEQSRTTWQDLINLWENSRGLSRSDRERLFQHNSLRNDIAHGKRFSLSRSQVQEYAHFVQNFTGVHLKPEDTGSKFTPPTPPRRPPQPIVTQNRGCSCLGRLAAAVLVIGLLISGYLVANYLLLDGLETTSGESGLDLLEEMKETLAAPTRPDPPDEPAAKENTPLPNEATATAVSPIPTSPETSQPTQTIIRVNASSNVRLGPSTEEGAIDVAATGQEYAVLETSADGGW